MAVTITEERPDSPDAMQLIAELDAVLEPLYATESRHGYSVEKLVQQGVVFFVLRADDSPTGCGGVQLFGTDYAEVKRMYVRPDYRGQGLSKLLLNHLAEYSQQQGIKVLRLETGIYQQAAIELYKGMGFQPIPPFGDYREDPVSLCFEKILT